MDLNKGESHSIPFKSQQPLNAEEAIELIWLGSFIDFSFEQSWYLQPIITQYFIDNKSEIWLLFLIAHSKRWRFNAFIDY